MERLEDFMEWTSCHEALNGLNQYLGGKCTTNDEDELFPHGRLTSAAWHAIEHKKAEERLGGGEGSDISSST